MAKLKSNIGQLLMEVRKNERNYELKQNFTNAGVNKIIDNVYLRIEEEHTEYQNILAAMPYAEVGSRTFAFHGLLLIKGKLALFSHTQKFKLFGKKNYDYTLEEHEIDKIKLTVDETIDRYRRDTLYKVSVIKEGENLAWFYCSRKIFDVFLEAFEQEQNSFL